MAVTYAWRLDANKYAYILDPTLPEGTTRENRYGCVRETPLIGEDLNTLATTANEWFGETDDSLGFEGYADAFKAMEAKIKAKWTGAEYYDLLSADVYYNVDSTNCADLRGVGIKGVKFLGTAEVGDFDINNPTWNPEGSVSDAGVFLVYGVYMEDQTDDDIIDVTKTPENIFVVKNGANGTDADGNLGTAELEASLSAEITRSTDADNAMSADISQLKQTVSTLTSINGGDLTELINTVTSLSTQVAALQNENTQLKNRLTVVEQWMEINEEGGSGDDDNNQTGGIAFDNIEVNDSGVYNIVVADSDGKLFKTTKVRLDDYKLKSKNGFYEE